MTSISEMNKISNFELSVDRNKFIKIFGENMGKHLWDKFVDGNHSILHLWQELDTTNKIRLVRAIK